MFQVAPAWARQKAAACPSVVCGSGAGSGGSWKEHLVVLLFLLPPLTSNASNTCVPCTGPHASVCRSGAQTSTQCCLSNNRTLLCGLL